MLLSSAAAVGHDAADLDAMDLMPCVVNAIKADADEGEEGERDPVNGRAGPRPVRQHPAGSCRGEIARDCEAGP